MCIINKGLNFKLISKESVYVCSAASRFVMLILVDTVSHFLHTHSSQSSSGLHVSAQCGHVEMGVTQKHLQSHTRSIYKYMNCKRKLLHCNANIKFNKTCLEKQLVPKYTEIKINFNVYNYPSAVTSNMYSNLMMATLV
jgi:hypothetical protein